MLCRAMSCHFLGCTAEFATNTYLPQAVEKRSSDAHFPLQRATMFYGTGSLLEVELHNHLRPEHLIKNW